MSQDAEQNVQNNGGRRRPPPVKEHALRADIKAYLDGELTTPRRWILDWHLAQCAECREEMQWLQRLGEDMKDLEKATPRPELRARILASLPETPPRVATTPVRRRMSSGAGYGLPRLALAGALMLLVFCGMLAFNAFRNPISSGGSANPSFIARATPRRSIDTQQPAPANTTIASSTTQPRTVITDLNEYKDQVSRDAEKLAREREVAEAEAREVKRQQDNVIRLASHSKEIALSEKAALHLELDAQDSVTSRGTLVALAQKLGGTAYEAQVSEGTASTPPVTPSVVALRIPSENVSALVSGMSAVGKVSSSRPLPGPPVLPTPVSGVHLPMDVTAVKQKPTGNNTSALETPTRSLTVRSNVAPQADLESPLSKKSEESKGLTWVTILVTLHSPVQARH